MVVTIGFCESDGARPLQQRRGAVGRRGARACIARCTSRWARTPPTPPANGFAAFDSPVGRLGMMICYDKAFPESARILAMDGAEIIVCMSAWPAARTNPSPDLSSDRWKRRFDLFDMARALENQVVWVSANQAGSFGSLRFVGSAKIVDPGGEVLADTGVAAGLAVAEVDVDEVLEVARRSMNHLQDRRPQAYRVPAAWV